MKTFTIDHENHISAHAWVEGSEKAVERGKCHFSSEAELDALARTWPGARLVTLWNGLAGVRSVSKFTDRKAAVRRIWQAIQALEPQFQTAGKSTREHSKTAYVMELLRRPEGATVKEIMTLTDWQSHTVRGFLSGTVGKRMGLAVHSQRRENGERVYRLESTPGDPRE